MEVSGVLLNKCKFDIFLFNYWKCDQSLKMRENITNTGQELNDFSQHLGLFVGNCNIQYNIHYTSNTECIYVHLKTLYRP